MPYILKITMLVFANVTEKNVHFVCQKIFILVYTNDRTVKKIKMYNNEIFFSNYMIDVK